MNGEDFSSTVRNIGGPLIAYAAGRGWIPANVDTAAMLTGVVSLAMLIWSLRQNAQRRAA